MKLPGRVTALVLALLLVLGGAATAVFAAEEDAAPPAAAAAPITAEEAAASVPDVPAATEADADRDKIAYVLEVETTISDDDTPLAAGPGLSGEHAPVRFFLTLASLAVTVCYVTVRKRDQQRDHELRAALR